MLHRPLVVLLIALAGALLVSLLSFWLAVRPPRLGGSLRPADVGLAVQEVAIAADDGVSLRGWFAPRPGAPAVVILHGYPAEKSDMLPIAAPLTSRFAVLLMDLRYFGESGGSATTLGVRERGDLRRAVDFLVAQGSPAVGVFGFSLGGAVAIMGAAEDARIRAVAAYAPFADLRMLGREIYGWLWLAKYPLVELMVLWGRLLLGVDLASASPVAAAARLEVPVLLVASREDEQISFRHAEALAAALGGGTRVELAVVPRGRHGALPADFGPRLSRFLSAHLSQARPH